MIKSRPKMEREILRTMEKFTLSRFEQQRDPTGRFWKRPSALNLSLRRSGGFSGTDAGITASHRMQDSFRIGDSANVARSHNGTIYYGSKLTRSGLKVAGVYQKGYWFRSALVRRNVWHPERVILLWSPGLAALVRKIIARHFSDAIKVAVRSAGKSSSRGSSA